MNKKNLFVVVAVLLGVISSAFGEDGALNFFVLGDWGGQDQDPYTTEIQLQVAGQMGYIGESFSPDFIIGVGDNFYDYGIPTDTHDPRFKATFENVYTSAPLQVRWYHVLGNHDWEGNTTAQIQYTHNSTRWYLPAAWYTETLTIPGTSTTVQFLFYDTQVFQDQWGSDLSQQQLQWIQQTLSSSTADWLFMCGHYPVWGVGSNGPTPNLVTYLNPLLQKYQVDAYISGHEHNMQHFIVDSYNVNYYISGAGHESAHHEDHIDDVPPNSLKFFWPTQKSIADTTGAFMTAKITSTTMTVQYIDDQGDVLYTTTQNRQRNLEKIQL